MRCYLVILASCLIPILAGKPISENDKNYVDRECSTDGAADWPFENVKCGECFAYKVPPIDSDEYIAIWSYSSVQHADSSYTDKFFIPLVCSECFNNCKSIIEKVENADTVLLPIQ